MATSKSRTAAAKKAAAKTTMVASFTEPPDKARADALAKMALRPSVNAAVVLETYTKATLGEQDIGALVGELSEQMEGMWSGDLKRAEAMLYGQAHALQAIFTTLARRAANQEYLKQWEAYLRMALKAQNQCRMTLETLATIKNPPVVIARQANINNGGQQQVNNGVAAPDAVNSAQVRASARTANAKSDQTELLEASDEQGLDTRTAGTAGGADPNLAAVGQVHRPANRRGQGQGLPKR